MHDTTVLAFGTTERLYKDVTAPWQPPAKFICHVMMPPSEKAMVALPCQVERFHPERGGRPPLLLLKRTLVPLWHAHPSKKSDSGLTDTAEMDETFMFTEKYSLHTNTQSVGMTQADGETLRRVKAITIDVDCCSAIADDGGHGLGGGVGMGGEGGERGCGGGVGGGRGGGRLQVTSSNSAIISLSGSHRV